jgi:hypothetical protein
MPRQFQLLSADIALGGDITNVVARGPFNPITYPELIILRLVHGGAQWITHVYDCGHVEREDSEERGRLIDLYGAKLVNEVAFPGQNPIPNGDNRYTQAPKPAALAVPVTPAVPVAKPEAGSYGQQEAGGEYTPVDGGEPEADPNAGLPPAPIDPRDGSTQGTTQVSDAALKNPRRPTPVAATPAA